MTPAQVSAELGGENEVSPETRDLLRRKQQDALRKVCDAYRIRPHQLSGIPMPDIAGMVRRVLKTGEVDLSSLESAVRCFIDDDGSEPIAHPG